MSAFLVVTYDITDPKRYAEYNPGSMASIMATLTRHGGEVLAAGEAVYLQGDARHVHVILKFPSQKAAQAWHDDPDYAAAKQIRLSSTTHINAFLVDAFVPPAA